MLTWALEMGAGTPTSRPLQQCYDRNPIPWHCNRVLIRQPQTHHTLGGTGKGTSMELIQNDIAGWPEKTLAWPDRRLLELLRIEHPLILAPMSRFSTPELAASVCAAGGLGSIGCAGLSPRRRAMRSPSCAPAPCGQST
jgi:Nitronate monooxygenase